MSHAHEESRLENMYEQEQEDLAYQVETLIRLYKTSTVQVKRRHHTDFRFFKPMPANMTV